MSFVVVHDANVLYGNTLRDLLIRLAMTGRCSTLWRKRVWSSRSPPSALDSRVPGARGDSKNDVPLK
ncbi:hypothetical protein ACLQ2R_01285 [Streptosporangium sp. DT93]|uniref:hypothetical protein n=1 Tax=Streptosporangium sp. DT93 TaxID=3393428 RepID=UPI003CEDAA2C